KREELTRLNQEGRHTGGGLLGGRGGRIITLVGTASATGVVLRWRTSSPSPTVPSTTTPPVPP
ncbi:hypothetical protein V5799_025351, partial [Amblyomma americanum]